MANLLSNPNLWRDQDGFSPPQVWDGTHYNYDFPTVTLTFIGTASTGDVVDFSAVDAVNNSEFTLTVNGSAVATNVPITPTPTGHSYNIPAGNSVVLTYGVTNTCAGSPNPVLTPVVIPVAPFAPDESIVVQKNSTGNIILPNITRGGVPISTYTLAIVAAAGHGAASISGHELLYTPVTSYIGPDVFTYKANDGTLDSNVGTVTIQVVAPCTELGRVTKANVSAFTRNQIHKAKLMAQEVRCLVANFNGALCKGRTIASVVWSVSNPMFVNLLRCEITGRETACLLQAQWRGSSLVRCVATLDNGEAYTQYFAIAIDGYWFQGDVPLPQGPYTIMATA